MTRSVTQAAAQATERPERCAEAGVEATDKEEDAVRTDQRRGATQSRRGTKAAELPATAKDGWGGDALDDAQPLQVQHLR